MAYVESDHEGICSCGRTYPHGSEERLDKALAAVREKLTIMERNPQWWDYPKGDVVLMLRHIEGILAGTVRP